ncbi:MAG: hypothetical protein EA397_10275 [Deltaproteobacteria bacterium]|nr:MAG: hypothetical protein EA397_10275 [Deltaproteobacteria bacterium]
MLIASLLVLGLSAANPTEDFLSWVDGAVPASTSPPPSIPSRTRPLSQAPDSPEARAAAVPGYRFEAEIYAAIAERIRAHPDRIEVERIGSSVQHRPLWAFHLSDSTPSDRRVLVFGGIHAMEWIATEVALELLLDLMDHGISEGVEVTIIPLLNPDGRARVERDLLAGEEHYRRGNGANVDLNRDFAVNREARAFWRKILPGYYQTSRTPLSQPETQALDALADRARFHRAASLHSFGGFFYVPWAGRFHRLPKADRQEFWALGRAMEGAWDTRAYRTRQLGRWAFFFRAHGTEIDHLYGRYGTRAFLIEVTRSGIQPFKPRTWKWGFRSYNPERTRRYLKHRDRTVRALRALIEHEEQPVERRARLDGLDGLPPPLDGDEVPENRASRRR